MKKIFSLFAVALIGICAFAQQCPSALSFRLVERNTNDEIVSAEQVPANNVLIELQLVNSTAFLNGFYIEIQKPAGAVWLRNEKNRFVDFSGYGATILAMASGTQDATWYESNLSQKADLNSNVPNGKLRIIEALKTNDPFFFPVLKEPTSVARFSIDMSACADGNYIIKSDNNPQGNIDNYCDVNNDNMINTYDMAIMYQWLFLGNHDSMSDYNLDVDNDGAITIGDYVTILTTILNGGNLNTGCSFSYFGDNVAAGEPNGAIQPDEPVILELTKNGDIVTVRSTIPEPDGPETMYLVGTMTNNWDINNPEAMTKGDDGKFTITKTFAAGDEMKFVITPGSWDDANVFGAEANGSFELSEEYIGGQDLALAQPGQNFKVMVAGEYEVVVDPVNMKAFFTKTEAPVVDELYIIGNFNEWNLEAAESMAFDEETGTFSITKAFEANTEFKLIAAKNWDDNTTFGGVDNENAGFFLVDPYLETNITMVNPGANFKIEAAGEYEIVADKENKVLVVTGINIPVTGIEVKEDNVTLDLGGDTYQIEASVVPATATNKTLIYESSDEGVLTVDENGLVTAVKSGTWSVLNRAPKVEAVEPATANVNIYAPDVDIVKSVAFTVLNPTAVKNIGVAKAISNVKYVNAAGMVSDKPFDGLNIVVTTYSDGSRSIEKMVK